MSFKTTYNRIKRHWVIAMLSALLVGGAATVGAIKGLRDDIGALLFPAPTALEVADQKSKQEISREFIAISWRRLYRSRQFLARIGRGASDEEIEKSWNAILESVEDMSSKAMIFTIAFGELYGDRVRREYEDVIQINFNEVTNKIVDLRYGLKRKEIEGNRLKCTLSELRENLDSMNVKLYQFSACFDRRNRTNTGCIDGGNESVRMSDVDACR